MDNDLKTVKILNTDVCIQELTDMLTSSSVFWALRNAYKNPTSSGMSDCDDNKYIDLYRLINKIKGE